MAWYRAGTITSSGNVITGVGTKWLDNKMGIGAGQILLVPGDGTVKMYEILAVDTDTRLRLVATPSPALSGAYAIVSFYTDSVPDFARRLAAQLAYYQGQMDGWQKIMTGTGNVTIIAPDGTSVVMPSFNQMNININSKLPLTGGTITGPLTLRAASAITLTPIDETAYNWIHWTQLDGSPGIRMGRMENNGPLIIRDYSPGGITALNLAQGQYVWTNGNLNTTNAVQTLGLGSAAAKNAQSSPTDSDTSKLMGVGGFGIGTTAGIILEQNNTANATTLKNGFYNSLTQWIGTPGGMSGQQSGIINIASHPAGDLWRSQILLSYSTQGKMFFRATSEGVWNTWREVWHSANTTVDSNGFIKKASPVVKLYGDGRSETNEESVAAMSERISEGVYKISGVLGFNSDDSWGGVDGGIEIPTDKNKQPLIWIDYEIDEGGDLIIKTYHRTHPTSPAFAQNNIKDYEDGQPIDIPAGRFVDLRVQMPGVEEIEPPLTN
ncbi:pyocin knob domain-containing protein [Yersinia kristensenii]|uniref:pyocin knob domain-containing protein n=2 Tax=Yersinia kristensenii TaxID=28152 RepID=UPI0029D24E73|nr:pyocin knob domain-containing protein [Yersinia kristensenii]MDX6737936.1 pyocin knob domain-containing protein [Yersinia kristensenii]